MGDRAVRQVVIVNRRGLHARASSAFARAANGFEAKVIVCHEGQEADGKSVMDLLILAASKGDVIDIEARGEDAEAAIRTLIDLVANGFGEKD